MDPLPTPPFLPPDALSLDPPLTPPFPAPGALSLDLVPVDSLFTEPLELAVDAWSDDVEVCLDVVESDPPPPDVGLGVEADDFEGTARL